VIQIIGPGARTAARRAGIRVAPAPAFSHAGDDVLACVRPAAATPWKLPTVEVACHGGRAAPRALLSRIGVPEATREAVYDAAVRRRALDRTRAEAWLLLPEARTWRAAAMLLDQAGGALARALARMKTPADARRLLETARAGRGLIDPPTVVLAGRANAGKSTLLNALAGRDRALVSAEPGTTRDPVAETVAFDGFPVRLVDTAGFAESDDALDRASMALAQEASERAALTLWVRDAREPSRGTGGLRVAAKMDLPGVRAGRREIPISALTGRGLSRLRRAILRDLGLGPLKGAAVFTVRQETLLQALAAGGRARDIRDKLLWT
jgi:tRNA U34 5-carboxymethylaminomethyl modifying GTPase MnmE/TrmE